MDAANKYDFTGWPVDAIEIARQSTPAIRAGLMRQRSARIDIGRELTKVHAKLGSAELFYAWCEMEFDISDQSALNYMYMAKTFGSTGIPAGMSDTVAAVIAAPNAPEPARAEVINKVAAGEKVKVDEAKSIVRKHKQPAVAQKASGDSQMTVQGNQPAPAPEKAANENESQTGSVAPQSGAAPAKLTKEEKKAKKDAAESQAFWDRTRAKQDAEADKQNVADLVELLRVRLTVDEFALVMRKLDRSGVVDHNDALPGRPLVLAMKKVDDARKLAEIEQLEREVEAAPVAQTEIKTEQATPVTAEPEEVDEFAFIATNVTTGIREAA